MKFYAILVIASLLFLLQQVKSGDLDSLQQRRQITENQVQNSAKDQQNLANQLARNGVNQLQNSAKQLQYAQVVQTIAAGVLSSKGLNDYWIAWFEGKSIVDNAINDIQTAAQDVNNGAQMITQCRQFTVTYPSVAGLVAKVTCLGQALINMKSSAILLPINLSRRVVDANAAISTIQSDILKCNLNILSEVITQSTKAGQAIADCISQSPSVNNLQS